MKAALYCRLSEEDRNKQCATDDSNSIQNQKAMLLQYAAEMGWEVYQIYSDDDYTGSDRRRPEFVRLLNDAEQRKFDIVLCKTQSRFTRELELVEKYIHGLFPIWGIRFVSIVDNADTANKGNKKSRQINGLVNEWYLEDMSENIRSVLTNRRENGFHIGAFALYGYKKDPDQKGHLIIDEEAAAIVREVFNLFASGMGKNAIARLLNDRGIPNPTEYKRLKGLRYQQPKTKNSTLWRYFAISDMLINEIYIGNMVQGKYGSVSYKTKQNKPRPKSEWYIVEGTHEPIIDRELWNRVQKLIVQKSKPWGNGTVGIFARKVVCANCGYAMRTCKNRDIHYLKCGSRHLSKDACIGSFIQVAKLERLVLEELRRLSSSYLDEDAVAQGIAFANNLKDQKKQLHNNISAYRKRIEEYSKGIRNLYMDKVKGLITDADYTDMSQSFLQDREHLELLIQDAECQAAALDERIAIGDNRRSIVEKYVTMDHLTRDAVEVLIDHICVGKRIPKTKDVPIEIHWNF
ncbi:MAG: DUF4368 domain-containing protein [Clostridiales bacterium]|nr:DUF4368 domain-containing protein [Clostridiales bacterium]